MYTYFRQEIHFLSSYVCPLVSLFFINLTPDSVISHLAVSNYVMKLITKCIDFFNVSFHVSHKMRGYNCFIFRLCLTTTWRQNKLAASWWHPLLVHTTLVYSVVRLIQTVLVGPHTTAHEDGSRNLVEASVRWMVRHAGYLTWLLISWWLCCHAIKSQVCKCLPNNIEMSSCSGQAFS